jgi:hypothetical protein
MKLLNPLPSALKHYERELESTFRAASISVSKISASPVESSEVQGSRLKMLRNVAANRAKMRAANDYVLELWPSLGLLDYRYSARFDGQSGVIVHDPIPIRKQLGYDRLSRWVASRGRRHAELFVHSEDAQKALARMLPNVRSRRFLHPIGEISRTRSREVDAPVILVAGQYKPERDLGFLSTLGPELKGDGFWPKIVGRGWPRDLPGWEVDSRFLSEKELDIELNRATVVLIPYKRYYQSGVAIRAIEQNAIPISPRTSFAEDVLGVESQYIVEELDVTAVKDAIDSAIADSGGAQRIWKEYRSKSVNSVLGCFSS